MRDKPTTAAGYTSEDLALVRATSLYVATKLGDIMDELVVIGGLVPSLIIDQNELPPDTELHVGTMDLDVGLTLAIFDQTRYRELTDRLRRAGFSPDVNDQGNPTRQRWKIHHTHTVTVDFLIPPSLPEDRGGTLRNIETDFAAVIAPGLHLAFRDRRKITLSGETLFGEKATRDIWVCGPGAYVVLKALAFDGRGENKDAYDLFYVLRNYGAGPADVALCLKPLLNDPSAVKAIDILRRDFADQDGVGPLRVAEFLEKITSRVLRSDAVGYVATLLRLCGPSS